MTKTLIIKKAAVFVLAVVLICVAFLAFVGKEHSKSITYAADEENTIVLTIDSPIMSVNGEEREIDPEGGTSPVVVSGRTLVPIRAIIEAVGGSADWNNESKEATVVYKDNNIVLTVDSTEALINGESHTLDTAPAIINNRTMLPIRFISEGLGFGVDWNSENRTVTITTAENTADESSVAETAVENMVDESSAAETAAENTADVPVVYMTADISSEGLVKVYDMLNFNAEGNVAVKMSTGEPPASNYLRPELIGDLVKKVDGTIVECNTAYGGSRSSSAAHWQVIKDHGLDTITEKGADIMDEESDMEIPASKGTTIHEDYVGSHLANYDSLISLAHFKGHAMAGYGGAIKNMSIGVASSKGKAWIHSGGTSTTSAWGGEQDKFLEAMGDATSGVVDYLDGKVVYINVMNRLSVDCDCDGNPAEPDMHDIGILASTDPVALDQACLDLVYEQKDGDGASLVNRIESRNGLHTLEHAEEIGLGSREYKLVNID